MSEHPPDTVDLSLTTRDINYKELYFVKRQKSTLKMECDDRNVSRKNVYCKILATWQSTIVFC